MRKVGVLCGGKTAEREISLISGNAVYEALTELGIPAVKIDPATDTLKPGDIDIAFIALHGSGAEDGTIQGHLETLNIPYTGSGILASAIAMDKHITKQLLLHNQLPTAPFWIPATPLSVHPDMSFPLIAKPIREGSSLGMAIIDEPAHYMETIIHLQKQFPEILVETFIAGKEITVSILEQDGIPQALPILELRPKNRFYDYEAKYTKGKTEFIIPASLSEAETDRCQKLAVQVHTLIGCRGISRVDMIVHPKKGPFVLEINTIPGLTPLSDLPAQAKAAGIEFPKLIEIILASAR